MLVHECECINLVPTLFLSFVWPPDVGTEDGAKKIKDAVGALPLSMVVYAAASAADQGGKGHPIGEITRENFQDMIQTSVYGKIFTTQLLVENLKVGEILGNVILIFRNDTYSQNSEMVLNNQIINIIFFFSFFFYRKNKTNKILRPPRRKHVFLTLELRLLTARCRPVNTCVFRGGSAMVLPRPPPNTCGKA